MHALDIISCIISFDLYGILTTLEVGAILFGL